MILSLMKVFFMAGGTWSAPVKPSMRLKTNKRTKRSIYWASFQCTQLCFSVESLSPCGGRHLCWLHSHAVEVFIFFWLWEVQILQCTRDDVTSDCCQEAPFVCLLPPLHVGFLSSEPAVLQPGLRGSGSKRGAFLLPLSALLLTIFPHACTEAINKREELRHTWLQYLIGRFLCQAPLPFGWVLVWPDLVIETSLSPFQVEVLMHCGLMNTLNDQW